MKSLIKAGCSKPHLCDVPASGRHQIRSVARAQLTSAAIATPQEVSQGSEARLCGVTNGSDAAGEEDLYAHQALVADYQYALRYYRSLKQQVGAWQADFIATNRQQPSIEDAMNHGGPQFSRLYSSFLEVRARLMVELPGLRSKLQPSLEAEQGAGQDVQHAKAGGRNRHSSINANGAAVAAADLAHPHPDGPHQVVDSVSTWLRADRYRRQRVVTAAVAAVPAPCQLAPVSPNLQEPSVPSPGDASFSATAPTAPAPPGTALLASGSLSIGREGISAENGVEMLVPIQQGPLGTPNGQQGVDSSPAPQGFPENGSGVAPTGRGLRVMHNQDCGALSSDHVQAGDGPLQPPLGTASEAAKDAPGIMGTPPWKGSVQTPAEGAAPATMQQPGQSPNASVRLDGTAGRLAEDANIAVDSRAKNALLAALQYKRAGGQSSVGPAAPRRCTESPTREPGSAPLTGDGEDGAGGVDAPVSREATLGIVGEVQRGDAAGAYMGRNRSTDALPEAFLVCP